MDGGIKESFFVEGISSETYMLEKNRLKWCLVR